MPALNRTTLTLLAPLAGAALIWAADLAWAAGAGLRVAGLGGLAASVLLLLVSLLFYRRRAAGDRAAELVFGFALFLALTTGTGLMSYLAATIGRPWADPWLARSDAALGFDWLAWYRLVQSHPLLHHLLAAAYASMIPQVTLCLFAFPLVGMGARNREFIATLAAGMVPTLLGFALFPAVCAWVYYDVDPTHIPVHMLDLQALRGGAFPVLDLARMHGLVTFPSYHAVVAVLLICAARGTSFFFLSLAVNLLMLASVPSEGGHYLTDLLAGVAVALASILLVRVAAARIAGARPATAGGFAR